MALYLSVGEVEERRHRLRSQTNLMRNPNPRQAPQLCQYWVLMLGKLTALHRWGITLSDVGYHFFLLLFADVSALSHRLILNSWSRVILPLSLLSGGNIGRAIAPSFVTLDR